MNATDTVFRVYLACTVGIGASLAAFIGYALAVTH